MHLQEEKHKPTGQKFSEKFGFDMCCAAKLKKLEIESVWEEYKYIPWQSVYTG
jgi:hypothetical protein